MRHIAAILFSLAAFQLLWTAHPVLAAPTAECRNLAKQFGEKPEALDRLELARLRTCITTELSGKLSANGNGAPAPTLSLPSPVLAPLKPSIPVLDSNPAAAAFSSQSRPIAAPKK